MIRPGAAEMVEFLNALLEIDRAWVTALATFRPLCGPDIAAHPTVQVQPLEGGLYCSSLTGLLNGYFGKYEDGPLKGHGPIAALYADPDRKILGGFKLLEESDMGRMPADEGK